MLNDTRCIGLKKHGRDCDQVPPDGTEVLLSKPSTKARGSHCISPPETFKNIPRSPS